MTWLKFKCKVNEVASQLTTDAVPIKLLLDEKEIRLHDITVACEITDDELTLIINLKKEP